MPRTLIRILDAYFASNTSTTKPKLFTNIDAHINKCPETHLDKNEKADLKNVLNRFITRRHEALRRRYVTHLQNRQLDERVHDRQSGPSCEPLTYESLTSILLLSASIRHVMC
ncbi:hypothetical protein P691DRAFT_519237 [Macrolepiota fuliginosa MF-IS2]|uniref:Uncharacterized protein n=1 Tax=Macrolepiota fuliginosa MF-IS2 TaxID=1400762 RepID=A0A9P5X307_9AGAR|nr:hypothetical protein P691DRAFT_519237 [Macrolepiota fuliginosa MF-IS2]